MEQILAQMNAWSKEMNVNLEKVEASMKSNQDLTFNG
jgi:hypothetical protein